MRLLIYSHYFAPSIGGVETLVLTLASGLATGRGIDGSSHFEVTLVTQTPAGDFRDELLPFRIIRTPSTTELWQTIRKADIVHVAGPAFSPILFGLFFRKPVVVEHHGFQVICPTGQLLQEPENVACPGHFMAGRHTFCLRCSPVPERLTSIRLWALTFFRRFICRYVAANIAPTAWLATQIGLPRSFIVHHGLATSPTVVHLSSTGPNLRPRLALVGRLVSTKGIRVLIEASEILEKRGRSFEVLIIGDGPERSSLENLVRERHLQSHVHFLGRLTELQLTEVLANVALVVVPSLAGEVFGMVVAENMLRGIPVLASNLGAFVEVLGESGLTFKVGDSEDLACQLTKLLDNAALLERMSVAGRRRILESFTMDSMIENHARIYCQLALGKGADGSCESQ